MSARGLIFTASVLALMATPVAAQDFTDVLVATYNTNPRLMAERERVKEADEQYVQARAGGRLSANAQLTATPTIVRTPSRGAFGQPQPGSDSDTVFSRQANLQIIQPLYSGGQVRYSKAQAKAGILAARESLRSVEQTTLQDAATAYLDVRRDEETARIRRNNVSVLLRQQEASTVRFDVGEGTKTDIAQADSRLARAEIGLAQADAQLQISRAAFTRIVGFPPEQLSAVPPIALPTSLADAISIATSGNPQLLASYYNQAAADAAIGVAKSAGKPKVSLNGSVSVLRDQLSALSEAESAAIAATVTVPLFAGGANRSRVRQAKHARNRAGFESRDLERAVIQSVKSIWAQIEAAERSVIAAGTQVTSAETAFEGVELEQQVGTRTSLDVLDAEQELLNARLALVDTRRQRDAAIFELLNLLGAFDAQSLQLPVDLYDPVDHYRSAKYEGMDAFVDKYVPTAVQKIGGQLPVAVNSAIDGLENVGVFDAVETAAEVTASGAGVVGEALKGGVDTITFQPPGLIGPPPPRLEPPYSPVTAQSDTPPLPDMEARPTPRIALETK